MSNLPAQDNLIPQFLSKYPARSTKLAYGKDLENFFGTDVVSLDLARKVTFVDVNSYLDGMADDGRAQTTIQRALTTIRSFYDMLDALGVISQNPARRELVRKIKTDASQRHITTLDRDEARELLEATDNLRDLALVSTMIHLCLRRAEAAKMKVSDFKKDGKHTVLQLEKTKSGVPQYVKVPSKLMDLIKQYLEAYKIKSGPVWISLSNNHTGKGLTPYSIWRIISKTAEKASLPRIGAHTLRHTGCTLALIGGASVVQVKEHARHRDINTTMAYLHHINRMDDNAVDYIDLDD